MANVRAAMAMIRLQLHTLGLPKGYPEKECFAQNNRNMTYKLKSDTKMNRKLQSS